jgi:hypothetical protein
MLLNIGCCFWESQLFSFKFGFGESVVLLILGGVHSPDIHASSIEVGSQGAATG